MTFNFFSIPLKPDGVALHTFSKRFRWRGTVSVAFFPEIKFIKYEENSHFPSGCRFGSFGSFRTAQGREAREPVLDWSPRWRPVILQRELFLL